MKFEPYHVRKLHFSTREIQLISEGENLSTADKTNKFQSF